MEAEENNGARRYKASTKYNADRSRKDGLVAPTTDSPGYVDMESNSLSRISPFEKLNKAGVGWQHPVGVHSQKN